MTRETSSHVPTTIGLVADDFTGAADSAAVFAQHGWSVRLLVGPGDAHADAETYAAAKTVLAVATNSRSLSEANAASATGHAVRRLMAAGVDRLFVKIDSTVRGPVSAQVRGAVDAWSADHPSPRAVVAPAYPAQGRSVVGGVVLVDGIAVTDTASGRDPFAPVASSHLGELLPGFRPVTPGGASSAVPAREYADAASDDDLDAVAELIDDDPAAVAVGSAGLAAALARRWQQPGTTSTRQALCGDIIVAVTSVHPVSARQLSELAASAHTCLDVVTPPAERRPSATCVAAELAIRVGALLRSRRAGSLIVVGGDGVAAVLDNLGATAVCIDEVLEAGCPTGIIVGGLAHGTRIVSKSGGFGAPSVLVDLVSHLRSAPHRSDPFAHPAHPKEDHHD